MLPEDFGQNFRLPNGDRLYSDGAVRRFIGQGWFQQVEEADHDPGRVLQFLLLWRKDVLASKERMRHQARFGGGPNRGGHPGVERDWQELCKVEAQVKARLDALPPPPGRTAGQRPLPLAPVKSLEDFEREGRAALMDRLGMNAPDLELPPHLRDPEELPPPEAASTKEKPSS